MGAVTIKSKGLLDEFNVSEILMEQVCGRMHPRPVLPLPLSLSLVSLYSLSLSLSLSFFLSFFLSLFIERSHAKVEVANVLLLNKTDLVAPRYLVSSYARGSACVFVSQTA
jgi:hypothetical protein